MGSEIENEKVKEHMNQSAVSQILGFVKITLKKQQPREDYR